MERLALRWLADEGLVDEEVAERAMDEREDPDLPELSGRFDPFEIARAVSDDLRRLYGACLRRVLLFGSCARGDAHPESDIDLLVVGVDSPWEELERMDEILDRHSVQRTRQSFPHCRSPSRSSPSRRFLGSRTGCDRLSPGTACVVRV